MALAERSGGVTARDVGFLVRDMLETATSAIDRVDGDGGSEATDAHVTGVDASDATALVVHVSDGGAFRLLVTRVA